MGFFFTIFIDARVFQINLLAATVIIFKFKPRQSSVSEKSIHIC
jgi:hypothetical protein